MNIIELAEQVGAVQNVLAMGRHDGVLFTETELEAFANLVAAQEREECAKLVVNLFDPADNVAEFIAEKILARRTT